MTATLAPLPLPRSLSPSKVGSFTDCPLSFRFSVLEHYPEPPSPHAVKGTLVHAALEALVWDHRPGTRTLDVALAELDRALAAMRADDNSEYGALGLDAEADAAFVEDARQLVRNYFVLEDPNLVRAVGVELGLETPLGSTRLRGIIDRLDLTDEGELVVVDYKTGRAPSERFERSKMAAVHVYALLCQEVLGRAPVAVRLLHLREPMSITAVPSDQSIRGQQRRVAAAWQAIERGCGSGDFRPRPGPLCNWCNFRAMCPAQGGQLPTTLAS